MARARADGEPEIAEPIEAIRTFAEPQVRRPEECRRVLRGMEVPEEGASPSSGIAHHHGSQPSLALRARWEQRGGTTTPSGSISTGGRVKGGGFRVVSPRRLHHAAATYDQAVGLKRGKKERRGRPSGGGARRASLHPRLFHWRPSACRKGRGLIDRTRMESRLVTAPILPRSSGRCALANSTAKPAAPSRTPVRWEAVGRGEAACGWGYRSSRRIQAGSDGGARVSRSVGRWHRSCPQACTPACGLIVGSPPQSNTHDRTHTRSDLNAR